MPGTMLAENKASNSLQISENHSVDKEEGKALDLVGVKQYQRGKGEMRVSHLWEKLSHARQGGCSFMT